MQSADNSGAAIVVIAAVSIVVVVVVCCCLPSTSRPSTSTNDRIDRWVDAQVEKNWRPMPGGNSQEDAATLTKAVMRAKSLEDLDRVIQEQSDAGR
jgi:hypothetical protein